VFRVYLEELLAQFQFLHLLRLHETYVLLVLRLS
jgi:hypothetical protein